MSNERTLVWRIKKRELTDLSKACNAIQCSDDFPGETRERYRILYDKIRMIINDWEEKEDEQIH